MDAMNLLFFAAIFVESFMTYSLLRRFDVSSTAKLAARLDLQKYEINPTITWLARKIGLEKAFTVTWLVIGLSVATADGFVNLSFPYGVPVFALIIGFGHVLAAAHNTHVSYVLDKVGIQQFEREHEERMTELASLSWWGRLRAIFHSDPGSIIMLVLALPLVYVLGYAMVATELFTRVVIPNIYLILPLNVAFCFLMAMVVIHPAFALGPLVLASRYSHNIRAQGSPKASVGSDGIRIDLPVAMVAQALDAARADGDSVVRISFPRITKEMGQ